MSRCRQIVVIAIFSLLTNVGLASDKVTIESLCKKLRIELPRVGMPYGFFEHASRFADRELNLERVVDVMVRDVKFEGFSLPCYIGRNLARFKELTEGKKPLNLSPWSGGGLYNDLEHNVNYPLGLSKLVYDPVERAADWFIENSQSIIDGEAWQNLCFVLTAHGNRSEQYAAVLLSGPPQLSTQCSDVMKSRALVYIFGNDRGYAKQSKVLKSQYTFVKIIL